jgi:hypothetical protein
MSIFFTKKTNLIEMSAKKNTEPAPKQIEFEN